MSKTVIISGLGLAGATLALQLLERGAEVYIYDLEAPWNASRVAAGVYNPIIPKRMSLTWMADTLIPACVDFYSTFEKKYGVKIHRKIPVYTVFDSIQQQNDAAVKYSQPNFKQWIAASRDVHECINQPYGGQWFQGSGAVDTRTFLDTVKNITHPKFHYRSEIFFHAEVEQHTSGLTYRDIKADYIICCEGYKTRELNIFNDVQFAPAKGEVLTIQIPGVKLDYLVQSGMYILPMHDDIYMCGATYEWKDLTESPTESGMLEMMKKISKALNCEVEIMHHRASVRPATHDRRPVMGLHPFHSSWGIFNGLGTKGVLLAPYFSGMMADHIMEGTPIIPEVSLMRYFK